MSDPAIHNPVDYASSNSVAADEEFSQTAPIPPFESAAASNAKATGAAHPTDPSHPPAQNKGTNAAAKKGFVVQRAAGKPTTMQAHRGQPNNHPVPTSASSAHVEAASGPRRTSWAMRESGTSSAMSSVARRRGFIAQDSSRTPGVRAGSESYPGPQSSVHRCRGASQASYANVYPSVDRRRGSVQPGSARAGSESYAGRGASEPANVPPFQLLLAGRPVPQLPRELEEAITAYYMGQLNHLSVADQERVVYAMVTPRDVKAVMTFLKQQDHAGAAKAAAAAEAPPPGLAHTTPARSRSAGVHAHAAPRSSRLDTAKSSSRRRVLQVYQNERHAPQLVNTSPEQKAALARFHQHFTAEACAAFLDDALDVCVARRTRCYQDQPRVAKEQGLVLPEEHLLPFYAQSVGSLFYNMAGWTQTEARRLSRLVVSIVHGWMPVVVSQDPASPEASREPKAEAAAAATSPQAKRPPVPMAPRKSAPRPVAVA